MRLCMSLAAAIPRAISPSSRSPPALAAPGANGTGTVPLGEATEAYKVDILDGPGGSVLRTITGLTSPAATYTATQQTADLGAPQAIVHLRVVQLSAAVGRGFFVNTSL